MKHNLNIIKSSDTSLSHLENKSIGIIGYGNQGKAHALNLKDRGFDVKIGLRLDSKTKSNHSLRQFDIMTIEDLVLSSDIVCLLIPDSILPEGTSILAISPIFFPKIPFPIGDETEIFLSTILDSDSGTKI